MEPVLQLGPVEGEEDVQHVLGRIGVAEGEVGLDQVQAGGRAVPVGVVAGGDQLDDRRQVAGGPEVAGDGDEHVGPVTGRAGEDLLVDREGAGEVARLKAFAGGEEPRLDVARGSGGRGRRFPGGGRGRRGTGSRLAGGKAVEETHPASKRGGRPRWRTQTPAPGPRRQGRRAARAAALSVTPGTSAKAGASGPK